MLFIQYIIKNKKLNFKSAIRDAAAPKGNAQ